MRDWKQLKNLLLMVVALIGSTTGVQAADWANKMFQVRQHDFGTVGRNAKTEYSFVIENCYEEDVHIASVRSSCGCTKPSIVKDTLKSWEKGAILAQFNTRSFLGAKSAAITVVIDRPYYAEVTLMVSGKIRSDIVVDPGEINFGDVDVGNSKSVDIKISYAGRRDWSITDVRGESDNLEVRLSKPIRQSNMTTYQMRVDLKSSVAAGTISEGISIVTNDPNGDAFTLPVFGNVVPPVTITPKLVAFGDIRTGEQVQQRLMIRGKTPFTIDSVDCDDSRFTFIIPKGEKALHVIPMTFVGEVIGDDRSIKQDIVVHTSLGESIRLETTVAGRVVD